LLRPGFFYPRCNIIRAARSSEKPEVLSGLLPCILSEALDLLKAKRTAYADHKR
jgi:hypothetical protein